MIAFFFELHNYTLWLSLVLQQVIFPTFQNEGFKQEMFFWRETFTEFLG